MVLEALALLSLVSGAFSLALTTPLWWLRLGDGAANLAPLLLMAVILLRFSSPYLRHNRCPQPQDRHPAAGHPLDPRLRPAGTPPAA